MNDEPRDPSAFVVAVASATGGSGKTFLVTSVADIVGAEGHKTLIVDLSLQFGSVAIALQLRPRHSLYDGLYGSGGEALPERTFEEKLDELVVHHPNGFDVLAAPKMPAQAEPISPADVSRVLNVVRGKYDLIVVDTPSTLSDPVIAALQEADAVAIVGTLDIPSLKHLKTLSETLTRLDVGEDKQILILNKVDEEIGLDLAEVQDTFDNKFAALIPMSKIVSSALNEGTIVTHDKPTDEVSIAVLKAARALLPERLAPSKTLEIGSLLSKLLKGKRS